MGAVVRSVNIPVYDEEGKVVSVDTLKKHDLLVVFWKERPHHEVGGYIEEDIQGTKIFTTLVEFESMGRHPEVGFERRDFLGKRSVKMICWSNVDRIHYSGHDTTGRIERFVGALNRQRECSEKAADTMRKNIDALKA